MRPPPRRDGPVDAPPEPGQSAVLRSLDMPLRMGERRASRGALGAPGKTAAAGVDPNTVLDWFMEAAEQLRALSRYCPCDVHVCQVQLDELYAVLMAVKNGERSSTRTC